MYKDEGDENGAKGTCNELLMEKKLRLSQLF